MKVGLMMVPFLCAAGVAMAAGESDKAADATPSAAAPGMMPAHYRIEKNQHIRLPSGDLRQCLEFKTSAEIIRCSETRRKK